MNRFVDNRKDNWQRLEDLLLIADSATLRGLSKAEVREFGELYRRTASDLAIARAETRDPKLVNYLNSLVIRAHGKIYRAESQGVNLIWKFFTKDFPQTFRKTWRYTALAFLFFTVFAIISGILCYNDPKFADQLGLTQIRFAAQNNEQWWLSLNEGNQLGASQILTNNILVSFKAFTYGVFFAVGTIYVLIYNGLMIGGVVGTCYQANAGFANELVTFMVGHGFIELSCIFIAGGAGMLIGYSIINPGDLTRLEAFKKSGMQAIQLAIGCAAFLVIAGIIEGFLSPSGLPAWLKFSTGILTGIAMYAYLFLVGGDKETENLPSN